MIVPTIYYIQTPPSMAGVISAKVLTRGVNGPLRRISDFDVHHYAVCPVSTISAKHSIQRNSGSSA